MWNLRLHFTIVSSLVYICIIYHSQGTSCATGDRVITQRPDSIKAKEGDNVSFSCTIDDKSKVNEISVVVDARKVMIKNTSHYIYKQNNIDFHGENNNNFEITVLLRNKSDSNTYYCEARVQGRPTDICSTGTFIEIPVAGSSWWIVWLVLGIIAIMVVVFVIYRKCHK